MRLAEDMKFFDLMEQSRDRYGQDKTRVFRELRVGESTSRKLKMSTCRFTLIQLCSTTASTTACVASRAST
jgi:flavoprotein